MVPQLTYLKSCPLKTKQDSFVARVTSSLNFKFNKPSTHSVLSESVLAQMSIVSSSGMLVKEATIKNLESCSTISSAKANESFTVHLLLVKVFKIGTRNFANI